MLDSNRYIRFTTLHRAINYGIVFFLAHLSHKLMVSYCHQPFCRASYIVCRQQFALNDIFFETSRPRALTFNMKHCLIDLYQVCSNYGPGVQNSPASGVLGSKIRKHLKIFFSRSAWLRCLNFFMWHWQ